MSFTFGMWSLQKQMHMDSLMDGASWYPLCNFRAPELPVCSTMICRPCSLAGRSSFKPNLSSSSSKQNTP